MHVSCEDTSMGISLKLPLSFAEIRQEPQPSHVQF